MAGSRTVYLIVAVVAIVTLGYAGHLGGALVYDYGAGTALMAAAPVPSEAASPSPATSSPGALSTVSVPTPIATFERAAVGRAVGGSHSVCIQTGGFAKAGQHAELKSDRSTLRHSERRSQHVMESKQA